MGAHKIAISVPEDVMAQVDQAAGERGVTRSRFIADVLRKVARARSDAEVTRRLDNVFADSKVAEEQRRTSHSYVAARANDPEW